MFVFSWTEFAFLCGAALLGIVCITPYTLELSRDALTRARERMQPPLWMLLLQNAQGFVWMAVASGLGLLLSHQIGLGAPLLEGLLAGRSVTGQAVAMLAPALILGAAPLPWY